MSRFPFPIPTGWFAVAYSSELSVGDVVPLTYFGGHQVLFRTSDGVAHVLDAFCPHLGAHLGHGGKLVDDRIVCPFHAWEFDGEGRCAHVPYATKQPKRADVPAWVVHERNGMVLVWHDLAGRAPFFEVPEIPEYGDPGWTPIRTKNWTVRSCNQEMAENQIDIAHFQYLHGTRTMPEVTCKRNGPHMVTTSTTSMTTPAGPVEGAIEVNAWGFGFTTTRFTGIVETMLMSSATPIDADHVELRFAFTVRDIGKGITGGVGKAFMAEVSRQLEQDIPVWENKIYVDPPMLCDGDGPIGPFRRWSKQFYPSQELLQEQSA